MFHFFHCPCGFFGSRDGYGSKILPFCLNLVFIAWKMARGQGGGVSEDSCGVGGAGSLETWFLLVGTPSFSLLWLGFTAWPELWKNSINPHLYACFYSAKLWAGEVGACAQNTCGDRAGEFWEHRLRTHTCSLWWAFAWCSRASSQLLMPPH